MRPARATATLLQPARTFSWVFWGGDKAYRYFRDERECCVWSSCATLTFWFWWVLSFNVVFRWIWNVILFIAKSRSLLIEMFPWKNAFVLLELIKQFNTQPCFQFVFLLLFTCYFWQLYYALRMGTRKARWLHGNLTSNCKVMKPSWAI